MVIEIIEDWLTLIEVKVSKCKFVGPETKIVSISKGLENTIYMDLQNTYYEKIYFLKLL